MFTMGDLVVVAVIDSDLVVVAVIDSDLVAVVAGVVTEPFADVPVGMMLTLLTVELELANFVA
jgi:hypothetical protein